MAKLYTIFLKGSLNIALNAVLVIVFCSPVKATTLSPILPKASYFQSSPSYGYKIIPAAKKTWGYEITKNNKTMIRQLNIPAIPGTLGFKTKEDAAKVAQLVVSKLKVKEDLPTISIQELKDLKVIPKK